MQTMLGVDVCTRDGRLNHGHSHTNHIDVHNVATMMLICSEFFLIISNIFTTTSVGFRDINDELNEVNCSVSVV